MFSGAQHFPVAKRCTCMAKLPLAGEGTSTDAQFVRRVFLVAIVVALLILLWALSEILLLIFAAVLLAVLLRAIAALVAVHIRADERWSLLVRSGPRCTEKASSNCSRSSGMTGLVQLSTIAILPCVFGSAHN